VADFEVHCAANGVEALDVLREHHPDLIISDVDMPEMDGYELLGRVRSDRQCRNIPLIFTSHRYTLDDVMRALDLGADGYLPKPFDFEIFQRY
jgi:CheY-like chemotaxis protein